MTQIFYPSMNTFAKVTIFGGLSIVAAIGYAQLQAAIDRTEVTLQRETRLGYLRELLNQLKISPDSQILVISKTSAQRKLISPHRALSTSATMYT